MAFNPAPTSIWPSYTSDGTNITIPIAALDGLTAAQANATTGDWRAIAVSFADTLQRHYFELADADKPTALIVMTPFPQAVTSGDFAGTYRTQYQMTCYGTVATPTIADEPA